MSRVWVCFVVVVGLMGCSRVGYDSFGEAGSGGGAGSGGATGSGGVAGTGGGGSGGVAGTGGGGGGGSGGSGSCGDDVRQSPEECDDGNQLIDDGCSPTCTAEQGWDCSADPCTPIFGDGDIVGDEECDDNNSGPGDGCFGGVIEEGWSCTGEPSNCLEQVCGDWVVEGTESCDDGNLLTDDGCDSLCAVEQSSCIAYVNGTTGSSGNDGLSWLNAKPTIHEGMDVAMSELPSHPTESWCEVWVTAGTYFTYITTPTDTHRLRDNVWVFGGFVGAELSRPDRDVIGAKTTIHGSDTLVPGPRVLHVVEALGVVNARLDGFGITAGLADGGAGNETNGGGILAVGATDLALANLWVDTNTAALGGGGLYAAGSTLTVQGCTFEQNDTTDPLSGGGGILLAGSNAVVAHSTFSGNETLIVGGAILVTEASGLTVIESTFTNNSAVQAGGAIHLDPASGIEMIGSTLSGNGAESGGAIYLNTATDAQIAGTDFLGNTAGGWGGALFNFDSMPTCFGCRFDGNTAGAGGAIFGNSGGDTTVIGCRFLANEATANGGGAIAAEPFSPLHVESSVFAGNLGFQSPGINASQTTVTITGSIFVGHTATYGAAVEAFETDLTIIGSGFADNHADFDGGAISLGDCPNVTIRASHFTRNTADEVGGAIKIDSSAAELDRLVFVNNTAVFGGGGLGFETGDLVLTNSLFVANDGGGEGGAAYFGAANVQSEGNTIVANSGPFVGGGFVATDGATLAVNGTLIFDNLPEQIFAGIGGSTVNIDYSWMIAGGCQGSGTCNVGGNVSWSVPEFHPQPVPSSGTWGLVGFDPDDLTTTFTDAGAIVGWPADSLIGSVVRFTDASQTVAAYVLANDASTFTVLGDLTGVTGSLYSLTDYRIAAESLLVDSGLPSSSLTGDLNGNPRTGLPDVGAYEAQ